MPGPLQVIEPPAALPSGYGLLEAATPAPGTDAHWQAGVLFQAYCPAGGSTFDECIAVTGAGAPPPPPTKADNADLVLRAATPFSVYSLFECAPVGLPDVDELATRALTRVEGWQVERAFWTGVAGGQPVVFPHLAASAAVTGSAGPSPTLGYSLQTAAQVVSGGNPAIALGNLEQALADCYKANGVIHAPVAAIATLATHRLVERRGAALVTAAGNTVVAGGGYPGTSPAGAAPAAGTSWLYATGRVFYERGTVRAIPLRESLNRAENTVAMLAERTYLLGWDCCHLAAPLTLGAPA